MGNYFCGDVPSFSSWLKNTESGRRELERVRTQKNLRDLRRWVAEYEVEVKELQAEITRLREIEAAARKYIADFWYLPNRKTIETEDPNLFDLVAAMGLWGGEE